MGQFEEAGPRSQLRHWLCVEWRSWPLIPSRRVGKGALAFWLTPMPASGAVARASECFRRGWMNCVGSALQIFSRCRQAALGQIHLVEKEIHEASIRRALQALARAGLDITRPRA